MRSKDNSKKWNEVGALLSLVGQFHSSMNPDKQKYKTILMWLDDVAEGEGIVLFVVPVAWLREKVSARL